MNFVKVFHQSRKVEFKKTIIFYFYNTSLKRFLYTSSTYKNKLAQVHDSEEENKIEEEKSIRQPIPQNVLKLRETVEKNAIARYNEMKNAKVSFWETENGKKIKEFSLVNSGRIARNFISIERYDNMNEKNLEFQKHKLKRMNEYDNKTMIKYGQAAAGCEVVFNLYGAVLVKYDQCWTDARQKLRVPGKEHMKLEGIDLRITKVNSAGLQLLEGQHFLRYLNVADCKYFDDFCMAKLHPVHDTLEFLDVSGTVITDRGFGYLRMFTKLRWLNLSRLKNVKIDSVLPFIREILPPDCVIVVDDFMPSEVYGIDTPYRHAIDINKDKLLPPDHPKIGDIVVQNNLVLYDTIDVHTLWQTPTITKRRKIVSQTKDEYPYGFLLKYIKGAEKYKPIF